MINLAIVNSTRVFAEAMATRLGVEPDIRVVRCATGAGPLRQAVQHSSADVVLGDAGLFDPQGMADRGDRAHPAVVLLAEPEDRPTLVAAVRAGVRGWVPRTAGIEDLLSAIRAAAGGGTWIPPALLSALLDELLASPRDDPTRVLLTRLTPREREVLTCLADGMGRPEVATHLHLSTNTVRTHVQSILAKLGVGSALAATALMRRAGRTAVSVAEG